MTLTICGIGDTLLLLSVGVEIAMGCCLTSEAAAIWRIAFRDELVIFVMIIFLSCEGGVLTYFVTVAIVEQPSSAAWHAVLPRQSVLLAAARPRAASALLPPRRHPSLSRAPTASERHK